MKWPIVASTWLSVAVANVVPVVDPLCSTNIANNNRTSIQMAIDCDDSDLYDAINGGSVTNSNTSIGSWSSSASSMASSSAASNGVLTGSQSVNATSSVRANSLTREPRYRPLVDTIVGTAVLGAILLIGVAGNIMVVAVVAQTRSMRTPTNCYLVSLSVADLMVLLSAIPNEILAQYILEDEWIFGRAGCAMFVFFQYLGINASSLSITAFTVERYIAICLPMKAQTMCTVKRAKKIILAVWLFALCYCCPWLFFLTTTRPIYYRGQEHRYVETCTYSLHRSFYMRFFFADIILFYVIPLILSCVLYGRMAQVLFHTDIGAMTTAAKTANGQTTAKVNANMNNQSRIQVSSVICVQPSPSSQTVIKHIHCRYLLGTLLSNSCRRHNNYCPITVNNPAGLKRLSSESEGRGPFYSDDATSTSESHSDFGPPSSASLPQQREIYTGQLNRLKLLPGPKKQLNKGP
ncbi:thyrotropin-releasing hormone receptor-like isoform X1 [Varroa jacobsoni]|uniref:thyrotropin-releasing hormone receptor-like isoform X1 n=1 Tax=Varroa jacobsoni TaxID=62625 RepID=UPI000BF2EBA0|nr:thyrotropin-releasing hormone receptor-like isoform X1 [Varroa jacobsoni]